MVPILRYVDAERAIAWLCEAFGFEVFLKVPGQGGRVEHARLILEDGMIMLASLGRGGSFETRFRSPGEVGAITQCTSMTVSDPDRVFRAAKAAGARIVDDIQDSEFGGRLFSCEDPEMHVWVFSFEIPPSVSSRIEIKDPPDARAETPVKPVFESAELIALCARLEAFGGQLLPQRRPGQQDVLDPEGNVVQLTQA